MSKLFPPDIVRALRKQGELSLDGAPAAHHRPLVKIVNPHGAALWLISELDPSEPDHLYGLCDLGQGRPALGWISRDGLEHAYVQRDGYRLPLERDRSFEAAYPLAVYALAARTARQVTENPAALARAMADLARTALPAAWTDWPLDPAGLH